MVLSSGHFSNNRRERLDRVTTSLNCTRPFCVHATVCIDHKITHPFSPFHVQDCGSRLYLMPPRLDPEREPECRVLVRQEASAHLLSRDEAIDVHVEDFEDLSDGDHGVARLGEVGGELALVHLAAAVVVDEVEELVGVGEPTRALGVAQPRLGPGIGRGALALGLRARACKKNFMEEAGRRSAASARLVRAL